MPKRSAMGELALIQQIRRSVPMDRARNVPLGIGDDCAIVRPPRGHDLLVTTDFSLEGRHFRRDWHPAQAVGHRCLARGLSDLAAMGAEPLAAFLSLALPGEFTARAAGRRWVVGFLEGLLSLARAARSPLSGGDTAQAPGAAILADIVLVGSAPRGTALRRSGARPGDLLYVSGFLGGAAAELALVEAAPARFRSSKPDGTHPHLFPEPRLRVGAALRTRKLATAAIDLSDGLSTDLRHLCDASGTGALVEAAALPVHALARRSQDGGLQAALHGGEDYELLFTARPHTPMQRRLAGVPLTCIGRITARPQILLEQDGRRTPLAAAGWEHRL